MLEKPPDDFNAVYLVTMDCRTDKKNRPRFFSADNVDRNIDSCMGIQLGNGQVDFLSLPWLDRNATDNQIILAHLTLASCPCTSRLGIFLDKADDHARHIFSCRGFDTLQAG